ncbi:MAG: sodium:solute symporter [Planctomycetota bacterium]
MRILPQIEGLRGLGLTGRGGRFLLAAVVLAAVEWLGRYSTSDFGDGILLCVLLAFGAFAARRPQGTLRSALRQLRRALHRGLVRVVESWCALEVDLRERPALPRGVPRGQFAPAAVAVLSVPLLLALGRIVDSDFRETLAGMIYVVYLGLLAAVWAAMIATGAVMVYFAIAMMRELRTQTDLFRRFHASRWLAPAMVGGIAVFGFLLLPPWYAILVGLMAFGAVGGILLWPEGPRLTFAWSDGDGRRRGADWTWFLLIHSALVMAIPFVVALLASCTVIARGWSSHALHTMPFTSFLAVALVWIGAANALVWLLVVASMTIPGRIENPARQVRLRLHLRCENGGLDAATAEEALAPTGWLYRRDDGASESGEVTLLVRPEERGAYRFQERWPLVVSPEDLREPELHARVRRRDVVQRRRAFLRGLERIFKSVPRASLEDGEGLLLAPQHWFSPGLTRDEGRDHADEDRLQLRSETIGPEYRSVMPLAARSHVREGARRARHRSHLRRAGRPLPDAAPRPPHRLRRLRHGRRHARARRTRPLGHPGAPRGDPLLRLRGALPLRGLPRAALRRRRAGPGPPSLPRPRGARGGRLRSHRGLRSPAAGRPGALSRVLSPLDWTVLGVYLVVVAAIGLRAARGQKGTEDFFLGGHRIPWWAAGLSIIATETSALTFIGAPVQSLKGDWTYLQLALGSVAARFLVAGLLIGAYYRARVVTVYDFLHDRFGVLSRGAASLLFFVGRSLGSGVRLYGAAIALVVVTGIDFPLAILLITAVAVAYTVLGGIRSVIWTDIVQGAVLVGGALLALGFLVSEIGVGEGFRTLSEAVTPNGGAKLRVFDFSMNPRDAYTFWAGLIGITFLTMATHGTDQDMVQRALTCRGEAGGRRSMWLSAALAFPIVVIFLAIGSALWLHFGGEAGVAAEAEALARRAGESNPQKGYDYVFPAYVMESLPAGVRGLIVAAIFAAAMSSLDSAIAALSATAVNSVWRPYFAPRADEAAALRASRVLAVVFGLVLTGIAVLVWRGESAGSAREGFGVLMLGLKVLTWIFPPLLGVFLVGVLTRRGRDGGNVLALAVGIGLLLVVEFWSDLFGTPAPFAWTWNSLIGCAATFAVATLFPPRRAAA